MCLVSQEVQDSCSKAHEESRDGPWGEPLLWNCKGALGNPQELPR